MRDRWDTRVSAVLPAYNEEANVERVVSRVAESLRRRVADFEIIVVDDGSSDGTAAVLERLRATQPYLRVVTHPVNRGYGAALRSGFAAARHPWIFIMDCDNQFDPSEIGLLLDRSDAADIVSGVRQVRRDPLLRQMNSWAFFSLVRLLFGRLAIDVNCAFKLIRRDLLRGLNLQSDGAMINAELFVRARQAGAGVANVVVHHFPRTAGKQTGANPRVILRAFGELIAFWARMRKMVWAPEVSIIIAASNGAHKLPASLEQIEAYVENRRLDAEVLVVEYGEPNGTADLVKSRAERWPRLKFVAATANSGMAAAVQHAMASARGRYRIFNDAAYGVPLDELDEQLVVLRDGSKKLFSPRRTLADLRERLTTEIEAGLQHLRRARRQWPPSPRSVIANVPAAVPWILLGVALLAIVIFDFGPNVPFNDDWAVAWSTAHVGLGGIPILPTQSPWAYVQEFWGHIATLGHPEPYLLRLSILPFIVLAAISSYRLARRLGANLLWGGFSALTMLATPIYLTLASSFMTDVPYVALLLAAADAAVGWLREGKGRLWCVIWTSLAMLQRQIGLGIPVVLTLALVLGRKERRLNRSDGIYLGVLFLAVAAIYLPEFLTDSHTGGEQSYINYILQPDLAQIWRSIGYLPATLGFYLLPFAAALLFQARSKVAGWRSPLAVAAALLGIAGLVAAYIHLFGVHDSLFAGDVWMGQGFTPALKGDKPPIFPDSLRRAIEILSLLTIVVLLLVRWKQWTWRSLGTSGLFLALLAGSQAAPTVMAFVFDRYYLPIAALLVPILAAAASRSIRPKLAFAWATATAAFGIALYSIAQQDYEAWQQARDDAAQIAYGYVTPDEVDAGYETNAVNVYLPNYESGRDIVFEEEQRYLVMGPEHPKLVLLYAPPDDPRPGLNYSSLAPGKIIISGTAPSFP
jgi:glycosyltransferase involved in cell wall biosynthesis